MFPAAVCKQSADGARYNQTLYPSTRLLCNSPRRATASLSHALPRPPVRPTPARHWWTTAQDRMEEKARTGGLRMDTVILWIDNSSHVYPVYAAVHSLTWTHGRRSGSFCCHFPKTHVKWRNMRLRNRSRWTRATVFMVSLSNRAPPLKWNTSEITLF